MKDNIVTESDKYIIPAFDLLHNNQKVAFAMRTMEYIFDKTQGKADIPHRHNYYTVLWVKEASGKHVIDYKEFDLLPNTIFFVSPGQVHQMITYTRPVGVAIMFSCDFLNHSNISHNFITNLGLFSERPDTPPIITNCDINSRLELITEQMKQVFDNQQPFRHESIGAWLKLFLIECNKITDNQISINPQAMQSGRAILVDFKQLVEEKFNQWHKVGDYASSLSITPDYLNNVIKNNIGVTAKEFIQNRIVIEAKRLGVVTQMSSKEIAFSLGFDDPAHFSKFFKNVNGASFTEFRNELQLQLEV